jgi:hypothetical protein
LRPFDKPRRRNTGVRIILEAYQLTSHGKGERDDEMQFIKRGIPGMLQKCLMRMTPAPQNIAVGLFDGYG